MSITTRKAKEIKIENITQKYFDKNVDDDGYFRLSDSFLQHYNGLKPAFGFNGLGEFVFYRTYSRVKPDGTKETFLDTARRVVEGCYEIQRRHQRRLHLPWDYAKAQESAQEMFERMWQFKFLPPGRGLWMMGTPFMWERGGASLNNCLAGSEEIITRDGIKRLADVVGTTQKLLTTNGEWVNAPINSFGKQKLMKITVKRFRLRKVIYATPDHRWFARKAKNRVAVTVGGQDRLRNIKKLGPFKEVLTKDLQPGFELQRIYGQGVRQIRPSQFGIAHGICFGDGTLGHPEIGAGSYIYLCGAKNQELLRYFSQSPINFDPNKGKEGAMRVADIPRHFKSPPNLRECKSYLYGFLAGYFAADGSINKKGCTAHIDSAKEDNMLMVREICAILGIGTSFIRKGEQTVNRGETRKFDTYRIYMNLEHLTVDFFLLEKHRNTFLGWQQRGGRHNDKFIVESIEDTNREEEVFCATVPNKGCFALADNILTGNCAFVSTYDQTESDPSEPFCFLMDMSMLGVGVGFDTKGAGKINILQPGDSTNIYVIPDSREGWVDSMRRLIWSYTTHAVDGSVEFDYSQIRPAGTSINGFGGKASGPDTLQHLHHVMRAHLESRIGQTLSSVDIVDMMNYIGACVVAGNVRRCLPIGTLIHLKRGLVPIEQVQIGDLVLTSHGYSSVAENIAQGKQKVLTIKTLMGDFRCTGRHRIAVLTSFGEYSWKQAKDLLVGDRMVFVNEQIPGVDTVLPGYSHSSTRGTQLVVPSMSTDVAWFLGYVHGDGYVYPGRPYRNRKHHGASVGVSINYDEYHDAILAKVHNGFASFGNFNIMEQPSQDNCRKYRVISRQLAAYFYKHFKQAKVPLVVPDCIRMGSVAVRAAYVAGLLDSDGSVRGGTELVSSIYYDFLRQVQAVYSSLGIPTKFRLRRNKTGNQQAKWHLRLVGDLAIEKFREIVQPHAVKKTSIFGHASQHDFGYPAEWVKREGIRYHHSWTPQSDQMTHHRAVLCDAPVKNLIPVAVLAVVDEGIECETYDLSVPDNNEFVAQGLLVHNSSEISLGSPHDSAYCNMKSPLANLDGAEAQAFTDAIKNLENSDIWYAAECDLIRVGMPADMVVGNKRVSNALHTWNARNGHRWASNNSIFAEIGMDYTKFAERTSINGEPGYQWLENIRDYGRMVDGRQPGIDSRACGTNPCLTGDMRLLTTHGYIPIYDLWLTGGSQEFDGIGQNPTAKYGLLKIVNRNGITDATNVYRTGTLVDVYRVRFDDGSHIDATSAHEFIVLDGQSEIRKPLSHLVNGDRVPSYPNVNEYSTIISIEYIGKQDTYCLTEPSIHQIVVEGHQLAQCGEQSLESYELCVSGDTRIQTRNGMPRIADVVGQEVEVWNGDRWSKVVPRITDNGKPRELYRVSLSDGSFLDCTGNHGWNVQPPHSRHYRKVETKDLQPGFRSIPYNLVDCGGAYEPYAFEYGLVAGDESISLTESVFTWDRQSILEFVAGWIEANGNLVVEGYDHAYTIVGDAAKIRDLQILLRRVDINNARIYQSNEHVLCCSIPSYECTEIPTRTKIATKFGRGCQKNQTIVSVEKLDGLHRTYCFDEPENHMGVFGNCLTYQCCLVETFPYNHESAEDYMRTLKFAYLYGKTVTLLPTHNARTNQVMLRNRRIGLSQSGIVQAFEKFGRRNVLRDFCDAGYNEIRRWDKIYSEWLCVPSSIKVSSVKPSGSISLLVGATPGIHHPEACYYWRRVRIAKDSVLVNILADAGYHIEDSVTDSKTVVVTFGVHCNHVRPVGDVSMWEQVKDVVDYQRYWADNQVSCTVRFKREEIPDIARVLASYEDSLKGISFLPIVDHDYPQLPYEACSEQEVKEYNAKLRVPDYSAYIMEAAGSLYCDSDKCEIQHH